jgi:hypothetical protein
MSSSGRRCWRAKVSRSSASWALSGGSRAKLASGRVRFAPFIVSGDGVR